MTSREIANHLTVSRNFISRRAKKEGWKYTAVRCRGGKTHDYCISELPADIRGKIRTSEIIRDKTMDWLDRLTESPWLDRMCWAVIGMAVMYFGPVCFRFLAR